MIRLVRAEWSKDNDVHYCRLTTVASAPEWGEWEPELVWVGAGASQMVALNEAIKLADAGWEVPSHLRGYIARSEQGE